MEIICSHRIQASWLMWKEDKRAVLGKCGDSRLDAVRSDAKLGDGMVFPGRKQGVPLWAGLGAALRGVDLVDLVKPIL
jgi:hypothetical protein